MTILFERDLSIIGFEFQSRNGRVDKSICCLLGFRISLSRSRASVASVRVTKQEQGRCG
jgi:hypothetical protein